ncbi:MAG TPA: hypothetical protein VF707_15595 [Ardenticatenaceae bacterium]
MPETFEALASDPERWEEHLRRLAEEIARTAHGGDVDPGRENVGGLSCTDCEELLDIYVTDELAGREVRGQYPAVWHHLLGCERCGLLYEMLLESLAPEEGALERLTAGAWPAALVQPWVTRLWEGAKRHHFRLEFTFNPGYLQTLRAPLPVTLRSATSPAHHQHLLLHETVQVADEPLTVELTGTRPATRTDELALEVQVQVLEGAPLPRPLRAQLTWGDEERIATLDEQGRATLGTVRLASLEKEGHPFGLLLVAGQEAGPA